MKQLRQILLIFFRSGMLGYGGGPSSIPFIQQEVVTRYRWMNDQEFSDILAIGNTLPGPIATKLAGYIGYRVGGILGCISGILAMVLPTLLLMTGLLGTLDHFQSNPHFQGLTKAISPIIAVMLAILAYSFLRKSWGQIRDWFMVTLTLSSFFLISYIGIHPAIPVALLIALSFFPTSRYLLKETKE